MHIHASCLVCLKWSSRLVQCALVIYTWRQPAFPSGITGQAWEGLSCALRQAECSFSLIKLCLICVSVTVQPTCAVCISYHQHLAPSLLPHWASLGGADLRLSAAFDSTTILPSTPGTQAALPSSLTGQAWEGLCCAECQAERSYDCTNRRVLCVWIGPADLCSVVLPHTPGTHASCQSRIACVALIRLSAALLHPCLSCVSRVVQLTCAVCTSCHLQLGPSLLAPLASLDKSGRS